MGALVLEEEREGFISYITAPRRPENCDVRREKTFVSDAQKTGHMYRYNQMIVAMVRRFH